MAVLIDLQQPSGLNGPPQGCNSLSGRGLGDLLFGIHSLKCTQENLVTLDPLVFEVLKWHEKLASMPIHNEIKTRREALGWSHARLAEEVSRREGATKKLSWQTVQQWENGKSAPKRTRLDHVAAALGCTVHDLLSPSAPDGWPFSQELKSAMDSQGKDLTWLENMARSALELPPLPRPTASSSEPNGQLRKRTGTHG